MKNSKALYLLSIIILLALRTFGATAGSLSQFGITWTFDKVYEYGQYCNGDYWVKGPVTITAINPPSVESGGRTMNGAMINPQPGGDFKQGYDSHGKDASGTYSAANNAALNIGNGKTLAVPVNSSLVSSISHTDPGLWPQLKTAAVLTVVSSAPAAGSFRPPYCGTDKQSYFSKDQLDYTILNKVQTVPGAPTLAELERKVARPWLDHHQSYLMGRFQPGDNMASYGQDIGYNYGLCGMGLNLDWGTGSDSLKEKLYIGMVQVGIDLYGAYKAGLSWPPGGGVRCGRKLPILLAGQALIKANPTGKPGHAIAQDMAGIGFHAADDPEFHEDGQTFYVGDDEILTPPYQLGYNRGTSLYNTGTVTITSAEPTKVKGVGTAWDPVGGFNDKVVPGRYFGIPNDAEANDPQGKAYIIQDVDYTNQVITLDRPYRGTKGSGLEYVIAEFVYYGHADLSKKIDFMEWSEVDRGLPAWRANNDVTAGRDWGKPYQFCCTANSWSGIVMTLYMMDLKAQWNHDAFFDYQDRYMEIIMVSTGTYDGINGYNRTMKNRFMQMMWDMHRKKFGCVWKRTNTDDVYSQGQYDCSACQYNCTRVTDLIGDQVPPVPLLSVSPNPAREHLTVLPAEGLKSIPITILNANGQMVFTGLVDQAGPSLDITGWQPGLYYIEYENNGTEYINHFLVIGE